MKLKLFILLIILPLAGCLQQSRPFEYQHIDNDMRGPGVFTGPEGSYTIYDSQHGERPSAQYDDRRRVPNNYYDNAPPPPPAQNYRYQDPNYVPPRRSSSDNRDYARQNIDRSTRSSVNTRPAKPRPRNRQEWEAFKRWQAAQTRYVDFEDYLRWRAWKARQR